MAASNSIEAAIRAAGVTLDRSCHASEAVA
jgi:hypothetical protein